MSLGVFAVAMFIIAAVDAIRRRSVPVSFLTLGLVALTLEVLPVPEAAYGLLLATFGALFLAPILVGRAFTRAAAVGDQASVVRLARLGHLVTNNPEWTTRADMRAWRLAAETDVEGARPLLERAAYRRSHSQPYNMLVLEAAYGHVDVPALIDQRWAATPKSLRPLLLHLAVTVLVESGRSAEALARLGRAAAAEVTPITRRLVLAEIAAATGDSDTLRGAGGPAPAVHGCGTARGAPRHRRAGEG